MLGKNPLFRPNGKRHTWTKWNQKTKPRGEASMKFGVFYELQLPKHWKLSHIPS